MIDLTTVPRPAIATRAAWPWYRIVGVLLVLAGIVVLML